MTTFLLAFLVLGLVIISMSVGVIFANKPIKGSCGGMSALGIDKACDICGGDTAKCDEEQQRNNADTDSAKSKADSLSYDASKEF